MIVVTTAPAAAAEPVTLREAKLHVKLITDPADASVHPDDAKLQAWIGAAREYAEQFCNRAFAAATYQALGSEFDVALMPPVSAITTVKYLDGDGAEQLLANTVYELNSNVDEPALRLKIDQVWPSIYNQDDAVRIVFVAGPAPAAVPFMVKAAMLLMIGTLYDNRQEMSDRQTYALPLRVQDLLMPYRLGMGV
ncbi:MAG: head-tail connector protein [Betaproteobacteria bacterium]